MTDRNPAATDQQAIERYRYMLRTAPPETLEGAHAEAFARLTSAQRQQVLQGLSSVTPENQRSGSDDPASLARMATRAEMRQPGTLERTFGGMGGGGMGGGMGIGGWFLTAMAASFVGTAIAQSFFGSHGFDGSDSAGQDPGSAELAEAGATDAGQGADQGQAGDYGQAGDAGPSDAGGDLGDPGGGDLGGGDFGGFGGGDFGGGDFGGI